MTATQQATLTFIRTYLRVHGYPPTFAEIGERFGIRPQAVVWRLGALKRRGRIDWTPIVARSIRVIELEAPRLVTVEQLLKMQVTR